MAKIKMSVQLLETITSALYDDPIILFREYVQNSVDAYNDSIKDTNKIMKDFFVDINIDKEKRIIIIKDNGYGIPENEFLKEMTSIGHSKKSNKPDQIGFRGIGRLSAFPYCKRLIFQNKPKGLDKIMQYSWNGENFNDLLNHKSDTDLNIAIKKISCRLKDIPYDNKDEHFFKVIIENYDEELSTFINGKKKDNIYDSLCTMLPLKYNPKFKGQAKIKKAYEELMGDSYDKFAFDIIFNGTKLYKPYSEENILDSDIIFIEFNFKKRGKDKHKNPIGLLWFTFNHRITTNKNIPHSGIFVRSKNMLMGNNNALVNAVFRHKTDDYISSYRELTQAVQGLFGELLINSPDFSDNARRDWFDVDDASLELRDIIIDFLKRLNTYRYIASKAYNSDDFNKYKSKLEAALIELISNPEPKKMINAFMAAKDKNDKSKNKKEQFVFADEDIPLETLANKKFYDDILSIIKEYPFFRKSKQEFLRVRAFIKKGLNKE